jgi:hypothetical protein
MQLAPLRTVYEANGPCATVYFEAGEPTENAAAQRDLRWRACRESLAEQGAPEGVLDALDVAVETEQPGELEALGQVLVAGADGVLLNEYWTSTGAGGDFAVYADRPELSAYIRHRAASSRMLVALVDSHGADLRLQTVSDVDPPAVREHDEVTGGDRRNLHKPRGGNLSNRSIQRRVEEAAAHNAADIVARIRRQHARFRPDVLVLAGSTQPRQSVYDELPTPLRSIASEVKIDVASAGQDALDAELQSLGERLISDEERAAVDRLNTGLGRGEGLQGLDAALTAARQGAVETLMLARNELPTRHSKPEAELFEAASATDAGVLLLAPESDVQDGIAVILRYPPAPTTAGGEI